MKITLSRSQALAEQHNVMEGETTLDYDTSEGEWVLFTYGELRTQDGGWYGVSIVDGVLWYDDEPWSDWVIEA